MKTIIKIASATYTLQATQATYKNGLYGSTDEERMAHRVNQVIDLAKKASKIRRKPVTGGVSRAYPSGGGRMSTSGYVLAYLTANAHHSQSVSDALLFFKPLSTQITIPEGVDADISDQDTIKDSK